MRIHVIYIHRSPYIPTPYRLYSSVIVSTWNDRLTSMSGLYFSFCPFAGIGRAWFLWVFSVFGNRSTVFVCSWEQVDNKFKSLITFIEFYSVRMISTSQHLDDQPGKPVYLLKQLAQVNCNINHILML